MSGRGRPVDEIIRERLDAIEFVEKPWSEYPPGTVLVHEGGLQFRPAAGGESPTHVAVAGGVVDVGAVDAFARLLDGEDAARDIERRCRSLEEGRRELGDRLEELSKRVDREGPECECK